MMLSMSLSEIYSYRDNLQVLIQDQNAFQLYSLENFNKLLKEWSKWDLVARTLKTQFYNISAGAERTTFVDKKTINGIVFKQFINELG